MRPGYGWTLHLNCRAWLQVATISPDVVVAAVVGVAEWRNCSASQSSPDNQAAGTLHAGRPPSAPSQREPSPRHCALSWHGLLRRCSVCAMDRSALADPTCMQRSMSG